MREVSSAPKSVVVTMWASAVVTVAALVTVASLPNALDGGTPSGAPPTSTTAPAPQGQLYCNTGPCKVLATQRVEGDQVELLTDKNGGNGRIRVGRDNTHSIFEVTIGQYAARLTPQSLSCVLGRLAVCLVSGEAGDTVTGELFVRGPEAWERAQSAYVATAGLMNLHDVDGNGVAELVTAQSSCGSGASYCDSYFLEVWSTETEQMGCTAPVTKIDRLPGYPSALAPAKSALRKC
ncbi:hypothetical protein [Allokutzneria sp. NRRL B-24872]|uniref:hypothetical protein n=1 Tax=Allokutzneria sp. NRRL B-24872 TaxID=1137961 RepID=UPI000A39117B|nr:hypothetical protein [Allokutzneria sp. NRRL B-24872]